MKNKSRTTSLIYAPNSPLAEVVRVAERMATSDATVLLTGETGTGKEVFARFLHECSLRQKGAFVPVNCGAIPENLMEAELFGHVRGAFTGAQGARKGRVAIAHEGTLFLDEIGEMPLALQVKLLRLLQEQTYEPVGSAQTVHANFRLVAATNRDLAQEVEAGRFRRDLYYRLYVCPLELPALRNRPTDIRPLVDHFWRARGETRNFSEDVFGLLENYGWPGNIRELENLVERLSVCTENETLHITDLPHLYRAIQTPPQESQPSGAPMMQPEPFTADLAAAQLPPQPGYIAPQWPTPAPHPSPIPSATPPGAYRLSEREEDLPWLKPQPVEPPMPSGASASIPPTATAGPPPTAEPPLPWKQEEPPQPVPAMPAQSNPFPDYPPPQTQPPPPPSNTEAQAPDGFPLLPENPDFPLDLPDLLRSIEDHYIDAAIAKADGNKQAAANMLSLRRTTLVEKIRRRETRSSKEAARRQKDDKKRVGKAIQTHT
jgi:sigma-54 dependent transcriptional regulator, flagellar regulatory protein